MRYAEILKYLDEEIERLQQARDLLAGKSIPNGSPLKKARAAARKPSKASTKTPVSALSVQPAVQVQRLPYKNRTRPQRTPRPLPPSLTSTALTSHVPSGPVVVSPEEARTARRRTEEVKQIEDFAPATDIDSERSLGSLIRAMIAREAAGTLGNS